MKILYAMLILIIAMPAYSQESAGKVHGLVFGDFFYKKAGDSTGASSQYAAFNKKQSGFMLRRLYLFYEHSITENFQAQFLLEGNDKATEYGEDKNGKAVPGRHSVFIKLANLEWKNVFKNHSVAAGLIPTPTWALTEKVWIYRSVEKTVTDFRGMGGATDVGVSLKGKFGSDAQHGYTLMAANGNGQKPENNNSRKYYFSFYTKPVSSFLIETNIDRENGLLNRSNEKKMSKTTVKGLFAYQTQAVTVGIDVVTQYQKEVTDSTDVQPLGWSVFAWAPVLSKVNAFARLDRYDPDTKLSKSGYKEMFVTAGVDFMPNKNVHIIPNIWINQFIKKNSAAAFLKTDWVYRVTLFYVYK